MAKKNGNDKVGKPNDGPEGLGKVTSIEDVNAETLVGDVRDLLLQELRDTKEGLPWTLRSEAAQREAIDRLDRFARSIIARTVALCAARGESNVAGAIKQWRVKDGLQIQVDALENTENIMALCEGGTQVRIIFADPAAFDGERAKISPAPDQKRLFGDDGDGDGFDDGPKGGGGDGDPPIFDNTDAAR